MKEEKNIETKPKRKLGRFLKSIVNSSIVRGVVKSIPFGNVVYEIGENISREIEDKNKDEKTAKKPHNWLSILIQLTVIGIIVYAFITHEITIDELIHKLNTLI